ncbi:MAG: hypothetical protein KJO09_11890 [Gammaproteobacteria bacterium]|nr:hypothetical protein [Gammaproteobacteria bacterium]
MSDAIETENIKQATPWHLWVVGVASLLWGAMGAMDYVMTQTRNEEYMTGFTPEQLEFFYGIPAWAVASWAVAVWGGVLGSILLLLRRRHALGLFIASLIGMFITSIQNFVFSNGFEVMGDPFSLTFTGLIIVVSIALVIYSRTMYQRGVLI